MSAESDILEKIREMEREIFDLQRYGGGSGSSGSPNLDGGRPDSEYGGIDLLDAGGVE